MRRPLIQSAFASALLAGLGLLLLPSAALAGTAYVVGLKGLTVLNTATNQVEGEPIAVGTRPVAVAVAPDGRHAYVTDSTGEDVFVVDAATRKVEGDPIHVGRAPEDVAIAPDGSRAYVVDRKDNSVAVIDLATRMVTSEVKVGSAPSAIAISPDGSHAYVANRDSETVSVINTATNQLEGKEIEVGGRPFNIAISADGSRVYTANDSETDAVSVLDPATQTRVTEINLGTSAESIAVAPDGKRLYVTHAGTGEGKLFTVSTASNAVEGKPLEFEQNAEAVAVTPDGKRAYAAVGDTVVVIDTTTGKPLGIPEISARTASAIAITPDQAPHASFRAGSPRARPGVPLALDASASSDSDGTVAIYAWSFGDRHSATATAARTTHAFASPGAYHVKLTLTDSEGCSTAFVFTGRTASCNGLPGASMTKTIKVAFPGVRLRCPESAGRAGCSFKLQVKAGKRSGASGHLKLKAGQTGIASLRPRASFRTRLARAKRVRVSVTQTAGGAKTTRVRKLMIVQ